MLSGKATGDSHEFMWIPGVLGEGVIGCGCGALQPDSLRAHLPRTRNRWSGFGLAGALLLTPGEGHPIENYKAW
jgi:hypothetical protein